MKKILFSSMLITAGIILFSCNGKENSNTSGSTTATTTTTTSTTTTNKSGLTEGKYDASGKITCTANGENYSCSISKVIVAPTTLTIQTSSKEIKTTGSITITCYTAEKAVTTGAYSSATPEAVSSVTLVDKKVNPYSATSTASGSSCTVKITTLTSTSVKGTFTATATPAMGKSNLSITNGVIDCTIASK